MKQSASREHPRPNGDDKKSEITIYKAKQIITMNPSNPEGTYIAVREGRLRYF